ncbi:MAG: DUF3168 domain-containing protein [Methylorubrum rhodinum]|uniref:DUF3168 domain-containing protein n=1 Tax=Methylorubrum rhodinum TaxID=29428 RepID=UPI003BAEC5C1
MSAELALQGAIVTALKAVPALAEALGGRVLDRVEEGETRPYLHLREFQGLDDGAECAGGSIDALEIFAGLDVWSDAVGKPEASRIAGLVRRALHYVPLALAAPWALLEIAHRETVITDDGLLVRARMSFRALVERIEPEEP